MLHLMTIPVHATVPKAPGPRPAAATPLPCRPKLPYLRFRPHLITTHAQPPPEHGGLGPLLYKAALLHLSKAEGVLREMVPFYFEVRSPACGCTLLGHLLVWVHATLLACVRPEMMRPAPCRSAACAVMCTIGSSRSRWPVPGAACRYVLIMLVGPEGRCVLMGGPACTPALHLQPCAVALPPTAIRHLLPAATTRRWRARWRTCSTSLAPSAGS